MLDCSVSYFFRLAERLIWLPVSYISNLGRVSDIECILFDSSLAPDSPGPNFLISITYDDLFYWMSLYNCTISRL